MVRHPYAEEELMEQKQARLSAEEALSLLGARGTAESPPRKRSRAA